MTEENPVYENASSERVRVNGILKEEFLLEETFAAYQLANQLVKEAIYNCNKERPYLSLNYQTPAAKHAAKKN